LGVSTSDIRRLAKKIGGDADLAEALWLSEFVEAKALAILVLPRSRVDDALITRWLADIGDWSTCDLFVKSLIAKRKDAVEYGVKWAANSDLYTKRAGLALIANYCMRATSYDDEVASQIGGTIEEAASDDRDHVRQACCWALREFGKSNSNSHETACRLALELTQSDEVPKSWVGRCAYRELQNLVKVPERRRLVSRESKTGMKQVK
jgi:3-methyladenine DNA glycosylase AlkD